MIKVYLDWNCITHSKDKFTKLKDLLCQYSYVFICPYSIAHLRDVQTNQKANPQEYERDLSLLTEICGEHMLLLNGDKMQMLSVKPKDYLSDSGDIIDFIQNSFTFPYVNIRELVKSTIPQNFFRRISVENNPANVILLINDMVKTKLNPNENIDTLLSRAHPQGDCNLETRLREVYYALDIMGYKQESKTKSFANIDTDAQHISLACLCDYLITDDKRMREKAKSIYNHIGCATIVKDPTSFINDIPLIAQKCFDENLIPEIIETYGNAKIVGENAHVKAIDYPLWGAFKFCFKASTFDSTSSPNRAIFLPDRFMFFDELRPLATAISLLVPDAERQTLIEQYMQAYMLSKPVESYSFKMYAKKYTYDCLLTYSEGLPALRVEYFEVSQ